MQSEQPSQPAVSATPSALFHAFATTCEQVAATASRLAKAALLRDYLAELADHDLATAARFFTGRPFAQADARVLNIGFALVRDVVCSLAELDAAAFGRLAVEHGEAGAAAEIALANKLPATSTLTLQGVMGSYAALVDARGPTQKRPLLLALLRTATPLEAKYLLKLMLGGDLRIGLLEGQLEDALARAAGVPVRAVQWTNMLLGDAGETALLARHGRLGEAQMRLFHPLKFMLASPIQEPQEIRRSIAGAFFAEDKYDGIRGQVHVQDGRIALFSRTLDEITGRFPELHAALLALGGNYILDGEILGARAGRILPFKELQQRLGRKSVSDELLARVPVVFVAYDMLYQNGEVLLELSLEERRARLEALIGGESGAVPGPGGCAPSRLMRVEAVDEIDPLFDAARARGNEGLVIKDPASRYVPGRRGREWLKVKKAYATLDVVVTAAEVGNGGRRRFLSDYTFAVRASESDPTLLNVGKAYSGLTDAEIQQLTDWFKAHTIEDFGRVRLVEPQVILEVAFDTVQPSARHKSGYALRFPRIVRIRDDKTVDAIDTLETVRRLAEVVASPEQETEPMAEPTFEPSEALALEAALPAARATTTAFLEAVGRDERLVIFCHFDADGLAAGALLARGLARMGYSAVTVLPSERGESAFADGARARIAALQPAALIVTDLGINRAGVLPGVPTLYVDHHSPEGEPANVAVVSGYSWQPIPCSAWLAYELLAPHVALDDLAWIAAIGIIGDLGERAPWPQLGETKKRFGATALKEAVALINAARRAPAFDIATPLALLLEADGPKPFASDDARGAARLRAYREEVTAALKEARRAAPRFAVGQPWALLRLHSPCQVHPLIAQQWRGRLPKHIVIAANDGYLPGVVAFSARTARGDLHIPQLLQAVDLGPLNGTFGHGHAAASGGHLPPDAFAQLLVALGFPPEL